MADIVLEPHDPAWLDRFDRERGRVRSAAGGALDCHHPGSGFLASFHVGSTAVPGLCARPVLDVLVVCRDVDAARVTADALAGEGGECTCREPDQFRVEDGTGEYDVAFEVRPRAAAAWRDQLVFRELLREDSGAREAYERVKRDAAADHDDPDAYDDAKETTVLALTDHAYEQGYGDRVPTLP